MTDKKTEDKIVLNEKEVAKLSRTLETCDLELLEVLIGVDAGLSVSVLGLVGEEGRSWLEKEGIAWFWGGVQLSHWGEVVIGAAEDEWERRLMPEEQEERLRKAELAWKEMFGGEEK